MSAYSQQIAALAPQRDPRHVEAYMRVAHSTLDVLSPSGFRAEVKLACACIDEGGVEMAERIARSFGL
jgi:hypothetical protein